LSLVVKLNSNADERSGIDEYYEPVSGMRLTQTNPYSGDITSNGAQSLFNVLTAISEGILIVASGSMVSAYRADSGGLSIVLAAAASVTSSSSLWAPVGPAASLTVLLHTSGSTTLTINVSEDGVTWVPAEAPGGGSALAPIVNGGAEVPIAPAPFVQIVPGGSTTLTASIAASY
jgi:hypothetical protein